MESSTTDSYIHKGKRKKLVQLLESKGINDKEVLKAIMKVPRHLFFDAIFWDHAYEDKAFPIGNGQTISQPYTVAFQTELLEVNPGMKLLEIGSGSGYQAAILAELGAEVYTIERIEDLFLKSKKKLKELGYKIHHFVGDGTEGLQQYAPFDRILVTAGAPAIPEKLIDQIKPSGILVIPSGNKDVQEMLKLVKTGEGNHILTKHGHFKFVPLQGKSGW